MNLRHLFRMAKWAHRPPSTKQVILVFSVLGVCLLLALIEYLGLWPQSLSTNGNIKIRPAN